MFNLMVMGNGWPDHESEFTMSRIFEYTEDAVVAAHRRADGQIDFEKVLRYPCLFMPERGADEEIARVDHVTSARPQGRDVLLEYTYDPQVPALDLDAIERMARELQMADWEFNRTHWALKGVDLFRVMVRSMNALRNRPTVFQVDDPPRINAGQMSVMMPFSAAFFDVYRTIQAVGQAIGMQVNRADDIWIHHTIIQDVVSLIDRSGIIVADCSGKNPNVFYEAGIAHALGREVILIAQHVDDIPFDLRHLRALIYLNNNEGRAQLQADLERRARTILERR